MDRKLLQSGKWSEGQGYADVTSPWDGRVINRVAQAAAADADAALQTASDARPALQAQSSGARRKLLNGIVAGLEQRKGELAEIICDEAGKPMSAAVTEVARAIETFTLAAAELSHFGEPTVPVDFTAEGTECEVRRFPAGVVVGVVPFNFPLNLGAHKVAPALAVGTPIIIKPPPQAPTAQLILAELALVAGAHPGALQVLPCDNGVAEKLATDPRVRVLSFTGSAKVGWHLKRLAAGKVVLELGGNAAAIVADDADLDRAAQRLATSAFSYAGQVCIKTQRIIVDAKVWDAFVPKLLEAVKALKCGDPRGTDTIVGPVIDDRSANRITAWVEEAKAAGAQVLLEGKREGRLLTPAVLAKVPREVNAWKEELFGPVVLLSQAADFEAALAEANAGVYGLQAGVFTKDWRRVRRAFHTLEVGGVVIDDAPSFRSDGQPYGGSKGSGLGREGLRWAMEDFTEPRALLLRP
jgi:glyceraldehyde-3-phosphate dehydrogenase (NADP+)